MNPLIIVFALLTFISTFIGGSLLIKFDDYSHYFFAFAAGSLISVAFLDLFPEVIIRISHENINIIRLLCMVPVYSIMAFYFLEIVLFPHHASHNRGHENSMGPVSASNLVIHSMLDGMAIGFAFQINSSVGIGVAIGIVAHDFSDGVNVTSLILKNKGNKKKARLFLFADALAPVFGVFISSSLSIPDNILNIILLFFIGEFIFFSSSMATEIHEHKSRKIILFMLGGVLLINIIVFLNVI